MRPTAWVLGAAVAFWAAGAAEVRAQSAVELLVRETPDRARDSIAQLVRVGLESPPTADEAGREALRLASAYSTAWSDPFLENRTRWVMARRGGDRAVFLRADSLRRAGNEALFRSGAAAARANWARARDLFARLGDSVGVTLVVGNIGASYFEEGRLDSAVVFLDRALDGAVRHRDWRTAGNAATILGSVARERGSPREAMQWNLRAVDLHRAVGNYSGVAADLNNAGLIAEELGDRAAAEKHYAAALDVSRTRLGGEREADYLVNLAAVQARRGARSEARAGLQVALAIYQAEGEHANIAVVHHVLGTLDAESSDYAAAAGEYRLAIDAYHRVGNTRGEVEARRLLASLYAGMGRPDEALEEISRAAAALGRLVPPAPELGAAVSVVEGDIELLLNRAEDARPSYLEAERLARLADNRSLLAEAIQGTAQIELRGGAYQTVTRRLEELLTIQAAGRDRAWTSLLLGTAYGELGDSGRAQAAFRSASADFEAAEDQAGMALTLGASARVAASQHLVWRALSVFAQARTEARGRPAIGWWLHLETGRVMERAGDLGGAEAQYDSALTAIEALADWVRFNDRRAMFLEDKWEAYEARAALAARLGQPGEAIAFSERLRARYLLDLLAERRPVAASAGALRAEERRLREEIGRLSGRALANARGHRGESMVSGPEAREALVSAQEKYRKLLDRMRAEEPAFARGLRGETVSGEAISQALQPDELLIEYLVTTDRLWIFAVTDTGVVDFATPVGRAAIRTQIDFVRWAMDKRRDDTALWRGALRGLDDILIEPVRRAGLLTGRTSLIVVPHRELHYLPFEALIDSVQGRDRYLVETFDVAYAPSASVWLQLRRRPRPADHGVVALAPRDRELVGTAAEVAAVAGVWGKNALVHVGGEATAGALRTAGDPYRIVHLATRGVLDRRNPLFSYVELAPEMNGDDGRLEVHEVYRMTLKTDLLVLTACQTGLGSGSVADVPNGDDWVSLVRAFVSAGANNVLATLWAIDDVRTAVLAAAVHRHIAAGASYARALALAKREALRRRDMAAPYYWAGLVLSGAQ